MSGAAAVSGTDGDVRRSTDLAAALRRATVDVVTANWPGEVYLYAAPGGDATLLHALAVEFHVHIGDAGVDDPAALVSAALTQAIARSGAAALMGCDAPYCRPDAIELTYEYLARGRNVIGPTERGGYYLIGLQQASAELFSIALGADAQALAQLLTRAAALGIEFEQLPPLRELDSPMDVWLLGRQIPLRRLV